MNETKVKYGSILYSKPIKDAQKNSHTKWVVKAIFKHCYTIQCNKILDQLQENLIPYNVRVEVHVNYNKKDIDI